MASVVAKRRFGPNTFRVTEAVDGGLLVTPDGTTGKLKKTTGPTVPVIGVNLHPVVPEGTDLNEVGPFGETIYALHEYPFDAAVAFTGEFVLTYAVDCAFGVLLYGAADGKVSTVPTGAPRPIGMCVEPLGVVVATKATGLVRLF